MLFNSYEFVLIFLPVVFGLFWCGGRGLRWRLGLLTAGSYVFYSWWQFSSWGEVIRSLQIWRAGGLVDFLKHWRFTLVMLASSSVDYFAAARMAKLRPEQRAWRRSLLALSLTANLGLLAFFKYAGFFSQIANDIAHFVAGGQVNILAVVLPVGISFYTFESMSYVIDVYRGIAQPAKGYLDYACFISFFPHLVAGPIIRYSDMLHQFRDVAWARRDPDWQQVNTGLIFFTMGMAKKLILADRFALAINPLWQALGAGQQLGFVGSWAAVLGYAFRIYFDFSGYSDMATGLGHMFALRLPQNFNSPYKATDASDFWRRWHMTLSLWLRDYLYIPLGGNRHGRAKQYRNLMITMLLGGLWHGAAWLFVIWGAWHGLMLVTFHALKARGWVVSNATAAGQWFNRQLTFLGVVLGWVLFRAADVRTGEYGFRSIAPALRMFGQMFLLHAHGRRLAHLRVDVPSGLLWGILAGWLWCNFLPNSFELAYGLKLRRWQAVTAGAVMAVCLLHFGLRMDFLYFRF